LPLFESLNISSAVTAEQHHTPDAKLLSENGIAV
jgi:hypothetical protein